MSNVDLDDEKLDELLKKAGFTSIFSDEYSGTFLNFRKLLKMYGGAFQAQIDELMLEYCPDEMTSEQIEEWGRNQIAVEE